MTERTAPEPIAPETIDSADVQHDTLSELRRIWRSYAAGLPEGHEAWRRGAAYVRDRSNRTRLSPSAQLSDSLNWLARRQIWVSWEDVFFDDASGTSFANRTSLQRLLAGMRDGRYSVIGAYRLDRLVRKPKEAEALRLEFLTRGVELDCLGDLGADPLNLLVRLGVLWQ